MIHHGVICDLCIAQASRQINHLNQARAIAIRWEAICPKAYLDTQIDRLPFVQQSQKALRWPKVVSGSPEKDAPWIGLNLWGAHRAGKTRTMLMILKHRHFLGESVRFFGPSEFAQELEKRDFKSANWIKSVLSYDIVAFDDIDKCKMTKAQEDKFFALFDARIRSRKPVFFTGNASGDKLNLMFNNGPAIVGRIREFCMSIHFPVQQELL